MRKKELLTEFEKLQGFKTKITNENIKCKDCNYCNYCYDCDSCANCILCSGIKYKIVGYWLLNKQVKKQAYRSALRELNKKGE